MKTSEELRAYNAERRQNPTTRPKVLATERASYIPARDMRRRLRAEAEAAYQVEHGR
jgi:hypothetical protein